MHFSCRPYAVVLTTALLSAAACSDSTGLRGSLTPQESRALAMQIGAHMAASFSRPASLVSGVQLNAIPAPIGGSVNFEVPCPLGGKTRLKASVNGLVDVATNSITADATGSNEPTNCGFEVEDETVWITGLFTSKAHVDVVNGLPVRENWATLDGNFTWRSSDGRSGECDVAYTARANYATNVATVTGNFCGATMSFTGPLTS
jgi:hypothetical protein